jgi:hypothetical protein
MIHWCNKKTEEVFVLKRELLKEKGSLNPLQSENLRIFFLNSLQSEGILSEKESRATRVSENHNNLSLVNEQEVKISAFEVENKRLRNIVAEKEKECKVNDLFHLNFEENILIESEIREEVKAIVLREMVEEFGGKIREIYLVFF